MLRIKERIDTREGMLACKFGNGAGGPYVGASALGLLKEYSIQAAGRWDVEGGAGPWLLAGSDG